MTYWTSTMGPAVLVACELVTIRVLNTEWYVCVGMGRGVGVGVELKRGITL